MANHAEPVAMAGAFVEDAEAQARFAARRRYLAWRGRVLPIGAGCIRFWAGGFRVPGHGAGDDRRRFVWTGDR